ncbi:Tfp pilus assembly protein FimT/FimU [Anatilimnocola sp. NA78]|uniref:pilus assembly FimT family protein n=1 Tax=Anatilimnocola sp. NA78 TaxID=3415683 RepID=UPI003CE592EB
MPIGSLNLAVCCGRPNLGRRARGAFSLMEIMAVLVILVVAGAIAMPAMLGSLRVQRLKSAAETMRVEWARAHVKAMKTGRIQVFRYELAGNKFSIQPWLAADEATETNPGESVAGFGAQVTDVVDDTETKELPEGVTFAGGDAKFEARAYEVEDFMQNNNTTEGQWSRPILFYPDGSATDSYVIVANEKQAAIRVQLRGLTGTSAVGEQTQLEDLQAAITPGGVQP